MQLQLRSHLKTKTIKGAALLFTLTFGCASFLSAQTTPAWVKFSAPSNYANYDVKEVALGVDTLGNVYTAASMDDTLNTLDKAVLVKHNSTGQQQWIQYYDNNSASFNGTYVTALLVDKSGNSYVCGYGRHNSTNGKDYMVMKYNNAGVQQWIQYWDGGSSDDDYSTSATFDAAGNIVVTGYVNHFGSNGDDVGVAKWSTSGTLIWSYVYNNTSSNGEDRALAVASDISGNIYVTGSSYITSARSMLTLKLNSAGVNQWTKIVPHVDPGSDEKGCSVAADAAGNCYATGSAGDWITVKYDPTGTVLWTNHYTLNGLNGDNIKKVMLDKNNNVMVAGDAFVSGGGHFSDLVVNQLSNSTGSMMWSVSIDNGGIDSFTDARLDSDGNIYVGGYFEGPLASDMSAMILSSVGTMLWNSTYTNPLHAAGGDRPYQVAVDKNHNFYLAGVSETRGTGSTDAVDVVTLKYNALVTGINEQTLNHVNLSVYPNPAKDHLTVVLSESAFLGSTITVSNMTGQVVGKQTLDSFSQNINLTGLSKGVYLLRIVNNNSVATGKFVIE